MFYLTSMNLFYVYILFPTTRYMLGIIGLHLCENKYYPNVECSTFGVYSSSRPNWNQQLAIELTSIWHYRTEKQKDYNLTHTTTAQYKRQQ